MSGPVFLTVPEIAATLRVPRDAVYRLIHGEEIPAVRVRGRWQVPERGFQRYVETGSTAVHSPVHRETSRGGRETSVSDRLAVQDAASPCANTKRPLTPPEPLGTHGAAVSLPDALTPAYDPLDDLYRLMLAETMRPCPELPRREREAKRQADRRQQRLMEELAVERAARGVA